MSSDAPIGPSSQPRSRPPGNIGLRRLIEAKRAGTAALDAEMLRRGFRGWHERGYLPHYDGPNVTQLVTFMLMDSFPVARRAEWEPILEEPNESLRRRRLDWRRGWIAVRASAGCDSPAWRHWSERSCASSTARCTGCKLGSSWRTTSIWWWTFATPRCLN